MTALVKIELPEYEIFIEHVIFKYLNVPTDSEESIRQTVRNAVNGRRGFFAMPSDSQKQALEAHLTPPSSDERLKTSTGFGGSRDSFKFFDDCNDY
ncbi:hypothetical protein Aduo_018631 [Ancylostoma duodenale]